MKTLRSTLLAATALCIISAAPAFAQGQSDGKAKGVPGPLAGAGLTLLVVVGAAGAYRLIRRRREESSDQHAKVNRG